MAKTKKTIVQGYALLFGVPYSMGSYSECIAMGALDGVDMTEARLLFNHDSNKLLASAKSGTLKLKIDSKGLFFRAELPNTETGREVAELIQRGDLSQSSWGFNIAPQGESWSADGKLVTLTKIKRLFDVSPVTYPANPETTCYLETPIFSDDAKSSTNEARADYDDEAFERRRQIIEDSRRADYMKNALRQDEAKEYLKQFPPLDSPREIAKHEARERLMWELNR